MTSRRVFTHPILSVETFPVQGPDRIHDYVRLTVPDWTNCVVLTSEGQLVLVRQHRYGIDKTTLEVPGGAVDDGEDPARAAAREVREETGYGEGELVPLGWVWANPAIQNNRTWLYLLQNAQHVGEQQPDPTERIEVVLHPADQTQVLLDSGLVDHSLAVVALQRALLRGLLPS